MYNTQYLHFKWEFSAIISHQKTSTTINIARVIYLKDHEIDILLECVIKKLRERTQTYKNKNAKGNKRKNGD